MTVRELITLLQAVDDQDKPVMFQEPYDEHAETLDVNGAIDNGAGAACVLTADR